MQLNGGFFGSMLPQGATSFMPQGASPSSMVGGVDGVAGGLTQPPMSPGILAALQKLTSLGQGMGQQNGGMSALPPNSFSPWMDNGGQPPQQQSGAPPAGGNPMAAAAAAAGGAPGGAPGGAAGGSPLGGLSPDMLKQLLARLGIGGGGS
jgi:hypothetical protein